MCVARDEDARVDVAEPTEVALASSDPVTSPVAPVDCMTESAFFGLVHERVWRNTRSENVIGD